jgi:two-component system, OmpR family, sensor histidine kinase AdeS
LTMRFIDKLAVRMGLAAIALIFSMLIACLVTVSVLENMKYEREYAKLSPGVYKELLDLQAKYQGFRDQEIPEKDSARLDEIQALVATPLSNGEVVARFGGVFGFYGAVTAGLAALLARRLVRPLEVISQQARRAADGDFTARAGSKLGRRRGEIRQLIAEFDGFIEAVDENNRTLLAANAAIAHELRTPITILLGRLHAIEAGLLPATGAEADRLLNQTRLLGQIVSDLKLISLGSFHGLALKMEQARLDEIVSQAVETFRCQAEQASVRFALALEPVVVWGDALRLQQALQNMLDNALRYGASGGVIEVICRSDGKNGRIQVLDRGPGLPDFDPERLFDHFVRGDDSRSRKCGGTGLGLAVVKAIADSHQGGVRAWSRPGGGAGFELVLLAGVDGGGEVA